MFDREMVLSQGLIWTLPGVGNGEPLKLYITHMVGYLSYGVAIKDMVYLIQANFGDTITWPK